MLWANCGICSCGFKEGFFMKAYHRRQSTSWWRDSVGFTTGKSRKWAVLGSSFVLLWVLRRHVFFILKGLGVYATTVVRVNNMFNEDIRRRFLVFSFLSLARHSLSIEKHSCFGLRSTTSVDFYSIVASWKCVNQDALEVVVDLCRLFFSCCAHVCRPMLKTHYLVG